MLLYAVSIYVHWSQWLQRQMGALPWLPAQRGHQPPGLDFCNSIVSINSDKSAYCAFHPSFLLRILCSPTVSEYVIMKLSSIQFCTDFILPMHNKRNVNFCCNTWHKHKLFKNAQMAEAPCTIFPLGADNVVMPLVEAWVYFGKLKCIFHY